LSAQERNRFCSKRCGGLRNADRIKTWGNKISEAKMGKRRPDVSERNRTTAHKVLRGADHPRWKGGLPLCADCGNVVSSRKSRVCFRCRPKIPVSDETRTKIRKSRIAETNPMWRGDDVKTDGLHSWVVSRLGKPQKCEHCDEIKGRMDWANKDHTYKRTLDCWMRLCRSCHMKYDYEMGFRKSTKRHSRHSRL